MSVDPRATSEFRAYERARDAVLEMKGLTIQAGAAADPSAYWAEELENIDYLIDATPLIVRKLRHHAFHVTGIRPYDYRLKGDGRRTFFESRLRALRELGGDALFVPESPALGGFGYDVDGHRVNVDTLKFYEVLIGMERGGVLQAIREAERPVVCEIGAGWAGFAYQFKILFPRTTYVIVDFPELFLFSATYLGAVFPDARLHFVTDGGAGVLDGWREADVVFVPNTLAHVVEALPLDLTLNMVSFQEMTEAQVRAYADVSARAGCPLLYSLNRERSPYNSELVSVSEALAHRYTLTEVRVLETDYTSAMKKPPKTEKGGERSPLSYRHLVGRLQPGGAAATSAPSGGRQSARGVSGTRVVLGMTLYNNAKHLREAMDSLLAQSYGDFALVLLDDASSDETEQIAREYERRDARVRYFKHDTRAAMIATWREVVEIAIREHPGAEYFAWVSDHDRWHPHWLERLLGEIEGDAGTVLAYPTTRRIDAASEPYERGARFFDTADYDDLQSRWAHFCRESVGSGDMVYGLIRLDALRRAGLFRPVLRPDKLLVAELTLSGRIRQIPEELWFRRYSGPASIARQGHTLLLPGDVPRWFGWPPPLQHVLLLHRVYAAATPPRLGLGRWRWAWMLFLYQLTYMWRHFRKSETFRVINRAIDGVVWLRKITLHHLRYAVHDSLIALRTARGRVRRWRRRAVYWVLVTLHRIGDGTAWRAIWKYPLSFYRRGVYQALLLTHRKGLRRRDQTPP